jgi:hypothetical protein
MLALFRRRFTPLVALLVSAAIPAVSAGPAPEQLEFFEKRVRPTLVRSCYPCHSAAVASPMGGLRLDTKEALLQGGKTGPAIQPGNPDASLLVQVLTHAHKIKMPPSGKLPEDQIADLKSWVQMGAPDPRTASAASGKPSSAAKTKHWAFQPVQDQPVPQVKANTWVRTPVDAFILAKLEARNLAPAQPAARRDLIRRVTYDLTGLPPKIEEVDAFLKDESPDAFKRVVDRLLDSPHYGERWARHWLDLVRYAETNGHEYDNDKLAPWRYRDYVIRAFNQDVPYDQFVREHIAGDLLPRKRRTLDGAFDESPLGTTFFWFGEVLNSATDSIKSRADEVDNQIDVMSKAFLGMTVACARCHDHKFDPIPTADYYSLAGVLQSTDIREGVVDSPERTRQIEKLSKEIREINAEIDRIRRTPAPVQPAFNYREGDSVYESFDGGFKNWRKTGVAFGDGPEHGSASSLAGGSDVFVGSLTSPKFKTTDKLFLHVRISGTKTDPKLKERNPLRFTIVADGYKGEHLVADGTPGAQWKTIRLIFARNRICYLEIVDQSREGHIAVDEIVFSDSKEPPPTVEPPPPPAPRVLGTQQNEAVRELELKRSLLESQVPESAFAMLASDYQPHNVRIHIRGSHQNLGEEVPRRFLRVVAGDDQPPVETGSGRLQIAAWMASPENPLTARVMVNRIWKHHFGRGLVKSPDNFGATGDPPTHPELLDYLASRFIESGWSVKAMHRLILLSSTYRMTAGPESELLQHMPVRRLEAEEIRDSLLAVAGNLDTKLYGPSIGPYISKYQDGRGKPVSGPLDGSGRRSIYIQVRRNFLSPMFLAFDYPLPISSIGSRGVSTVPSQALLLLNNEFVVHEAAKWSARIVAAAPEPRARISLMYRSAFARDPEPQEIENISAFAKSQAELHRIPGVDEQTIEQRVWADIAHVLINSPEFIYLR